MSLAKTEFIVRIRCLNISVQSEATLNKGLADVEHNAIARMLRNGLAVVGFAALEDFIKRRTAEAMQEVSLCAIPFNALPEKLRYAATYEMLSALSHQLGLIPKDDATGNADKIDYIQGQALKIASTTTASYTLSNHTFAHSASNVHKDVIGNILKSLQVADPWRQMTIISGHLGLGSHSLVQQYESAAKRRHKAAHVASADTPSNDISQFVKDAFAIAIGFDALLSKSIQKYRENATPHNSDITAAEISIRTVRHQNSAWKEHNNLNARAYRKSNDLAVLSAAAKQRSNTAKQLYVEFDENSIPNDWECY
ncbi:HEPN domain-containing protein [Aeromonas molluscorum]|uniref:HEPN domain-containing protein n=1 Tax=Aeromonas molluscorum TaxID=271417 RepID=UPI000A06FF90|nr:HEPN domain-containing protein [Aeromonas molluscorum]